MRQGNFLGQVTDFVRNGKRTHRVVYLFFFNRRVTSQQWYFYEKQHAMKILFVAFVLSLTLTLIGKAQTQKGQWTLGTQIGDLSYVDQNGGKSLSINITPSAGYFVANGLVLGTGIPIGIGSQKTTNDNTDFRFKSTSFSVGLLPFVRYFIGPSKLKPYIGLSYSYSRLNFTNMRTDPSGSYSSEGKGKITALVPTLGLAYFINQYLGLTAGLNYNINHNDQSATTSDPISPTSSSSYASDYKSLSVGVGFQIFIGK